MLTHIDLFSGIGGFALAAEWAGFRTVCFVEIESYAQEIIKERFGAVSISDAIGRNGRENQGQRRREVGPQQFTPSDCPRLYRDIRRFDGIPYRGATLLTGGFPCQPFSQAGKRRGKEDDRYLWPEMLRVIQEARPAWVLGENVAGIIGMELDRCVSDLEGEGYSVQPLVIPACAVDAKHRRDRVWIVGHAECMRRGQSTGNFASTSEPFHSTEREEGALRFRSAGQDVADAEGRSLRTGLCENKSTGEWRRRSSNGGCEGIRWLPEPNVGRVANGIPRRVDRLKALGNAIVPQVAHQILRGIAEIEHG